MKRQNTGIALLFLTASFFSAGTTAASQRADESAAVRHSIRMIFDDEITNTMTSDPSSTQTMRSSDGRTMIRVHELTGEIDAIHAELMQDEWFEHHKFDRDVPVLWDIRKTKLPDDIEFISRVVSELIQKSTQERPEGRASIVVSNKRDFGNLCRAYQNSIQSGRMLVTIQMAEARRWLRNAELTQSNPCSF